MIIEAQQDVDAVGGEEVKEFMRRPEALLGLRAFGDIATGLVDAVPQLHCTQVVATLRAAKQLLRVHPIVEDQRLAGLHHPDVGLKQL